VNQIVEGKRLILELVEDVDALAGSLEKGRGTHSVEAMKMAVFHCFRSHRLYADRLAGEVTGEN
jgi:hypothetical protein